MVKLGELFKNSLYKLYVQTRNIVVKNRRIVKCKYDGYLYT